MSLVRQVVTQCSEISFRVTHMWPPSSSFLSSPSSLVSSLIPHALPPPFLSHRLPSFSSSSLPRSLPFSLSSLISFLPLLSIASSLRPSSSPSFPLSISSLPPFQFPLPEVVVIHRDPSCHEDLRHLKNYILEVRTRMF